MSVLKIRNKNNEWTSIPAIKGDKGDQGVGIQEIKIVNSKLIIKYDNNKEQIIDNLTQIGTISQVDETYSDTSENPQSGKAVADAINQFNNNVSTNINTQVEAYIKNQLSSTNTNSELNKALTNINSDIKTIETNIDTIETNIANINSDIDTIETNIANINSDIDTIETNIANINEEVRPIDKGGTGATKAFQALANLSGLSLTYANTLITEDNSETLSIDFNTVQTPGTYWVAYDSVKLVTKYKTDGTTYKDSNSLNSPMTSMGFKLIVMQGYTSNRLHQFALSGSTTQNNTPIIKYRSYYKDSNTGKEYWTEWVQLLDTSTPYVTQKSSVDVIIPDENNSPITDKDVFRYTKWSNGDIVGDLKVKVKYSGSTVTTVYIDFPSSIFNDGITYTSFLYATPLTNSGAIMSNLRYSQLPDDLTMPQTISGNKKYRLKFNVYYDGTISNQQNYFKLNIKLYTIKEK